MAPTGTWVKMLVAGGAMCIGGPALVYYVSPSEEEIFLRYNPELQRRSLANRQERQEDFDQFVTRLKRLSKSDKPIWTAWEQENERLRQEAADKAIEDRKAQQSTSEALRAELKKAASK